MRARHLGALSALVATAALALSACGSATKIAENAINDQLSGSASVSIGDDGKVKVDSSDGSFQYGTGELPAGWPAEVTSPPGLTLVTSFGSGDVLSGTWQADGDVRADVKSYVDSLKAAGLKDDPDFGQGLPDMYGLVGSNYKVNIITSVESGKTAVIVSITKDS